MNSTPMSMRKHITIFGSINAGKSALFNAIIGQDMMIVSDRQATTTDPVTKAMELVGFGAVALTDTAGFGDVSPLGNERMKKTKQLLKNCDFAVYAADSSAFSADEYERVRAEFDRYEIPHILVFTKSDLTDNIPSYPNSAAVSVKDGVSIDRLRAVIVQRLKELPDREYGMLTGISKRLNTVVAAVKVDSEAPKGRLILPQQQLIRECVDNGIRVVVVNGDELGAVMREEKKADLVVVDSQTFKTAKNAVPENIPLTSYSILQARAKCDLGILIEGAKRIDTLKDGDRILMAEACTHSSTHEDIGRVKLPNMLRKYSGKNLEFEYFVYRDFPDNLADYALVMHCGGCMINAKTMQNRINICKEAGTAVTNYGIAIAYMNGVLERDLGILM